MPTCSAHRRQLPAPIRSRADAIAALRLATDDGRDDVVALACLDAVRRPLTMFIVEGCAATAADVRRAVDVLLDAVADVDTPLAAVIVAASRPGEPAAPAGRAGEPAGPAGRAGVTPLDVETWTDLQISCDSAGIELLEYFVLSDGEAHGVGEQHGDGPAW